MANNIATTSNGKPVPIVFRGVGNTSDDVVQSNLEATFARGYEKRFNELQNSVKGGTVSIVGSGFSLWRTYKDITGDVLACNSAHDFLIEHGIIPTYAMFWDAHPIIAKFITKPHKDVKYLVASRCHPSIFKALEGYDVTVWHALGGGDIEEQLIKHNRMEPMLGGGSAGVTRALYVLGEMGYKEMHLFGVCDDNDGKNTHVNGSVVEQKFIDLRVCGKWWKIAPWMALQAGDLRMLAPLMQDRGVKLVIHGKGFLPYLATFLGLETPDLKVGLVEKVRRMVHTAVLVFLDLKKSPQLLGGSNAGN